MCKMQIFIDPTAEESLALVRELATAGATEMLSSSEVIVEGDARDIVMIADQHPAAILKMEVV